jgi:hypothetical protein
VRLEGLGRLKNPMTSTVELTTFRLAAKCPPDQVHTYCKHKHILQSGCGPGVRKTALTKHDSSDDTAVTNNDDITFCLIHGMG